MPKDAKICIRFHKSTNPNENINRQSDNILVVVDNQD